MIASALAQSMNCSLCGLRDTLDDISAPANGTRPTMQQVHPLKPCGKSQRQAGSGRHGNVRIKAAGFPICGFDPLDFQLTLPRQASRRLPPLQGLWRPENQR